MVLIKKPKVTANAQGISILATLRQALIVWILLTIICGLIYPLAVTGIAQAAFPHQASGSLLTDHGQPIGSELIGQAFTGSGVFWSRPSATGSTPYDGTNSMGSNLGPTNPVLIEAVKTRIAKLKAADPHNSSPIPVDLVTTSGSGLDPHISAAAAYYQIMRVARERRLPEKQIKTLVDTHVEHPFLGFFGEPRVNVLKLNHSLERLTLKQQYPSD